MTPKLADAITTPEVEFTPNATTVLEKRYLKKDAEGNPIETPAEMLRRVADNIASAEAIFDRTADVKKWSDAFFAMMATREFMPNSPTLMNAGRDLQQLSACFVLPVGDSMEEIFDTLKHAAVIHKSGGGTGFSFSRIRPKNDRVNTTHGVASGPVSFMSVYDSATEHVKQGGNRRGANMGILRVDHPDILDFITCKHSSDDLITNFNISVAVTEDFMEKVKADQEYDLINPRDGEVAGSLRARDVFHRIIHSAWRNGDPGIVFIDRMNDPRTNPTPAVGQIESTNPCGEQPLLPFESCNLASINLERFLTEAGDEPIDWDRLRTTIHNGVRFLDDVIEVNRYPVDQIAKITREGNRKIGLGVMGWADLLFRLGIPYDSEEATELGERIMKFISEEADAASEALAEERGVFPNWYGSYYEQINRKMRNATRTTIAPTGTISIIAGCSSGIEPLFALAYFRKVLDGEQLIEIDPYFEKASREQGFYSPELMESVVEEGGVRHLPEVPEEMRDVFVTAHDVTPQWHLRHQAAWQKHTDNAVSKTVNFPSSATPEDVEDVYMLAFELGCKGVTIYRDGSKEWQVLNVGVPGEKDLTDSLDDRSKIVGADGDMRLVVAEPQPILPRAVPDGEHGMGARRFRVPTPLGMMNVFVSELDGQPFEVFIVFGKAGSDTTAFAEAIGRLISLSLRCGIPLNLLVEQLKGIGGRSAIGFGDKRVLSVPDALAKLLERHYLTSNGNGNGNGNSGSAQIDPVTPAVASAPAARARGGGMEICPDCQEYAYEFAEGCGKCYACGFSNC